MSSTERDNYTMEVCEECRGYGFKTNMYHKSDEECTNCDGEGAIYLRRQGKDD